MLNSIAFNDRALKYRAYRKVRRLGETLFANINQKPVFILGNQKTGTTAIALLLSDAIGQSVTIDLVKEMQHPEFQYLFDHFNKFDDFISKNRVDFSRQLIKEPNLTLFYAMLRKRFPSAQFIMVVRDPRDNIRSILDRLRLSGTANLSVESIKPTISEAWYYVIDNRWYLDCSEHYIDSLSSRWNFMADVYLNNKDDMTLVRYEDFLKNKTKAIQQLATALGTTIRRDIGHLVDRQFQGRGAHKHIDVRQFFSPANIRKINSACGERMAALGYETGF